MVHPRCFEVVGHKLSLTGYQGALDWATSLGEVELRENALAGILSSLGEKKWGLAWSQVQGGLTAGARVKILGEYAGDLALRDPGRAEQWVMSLPARDRGEVGELYFLL